MGIGGGARPPRAGLTLALLAPLAWACASTSGEGERPHEPPRAPVAAPASGPSSTPPVTQDPPAQQVPPPSEPALFSLAEVRARILERSNLRLMAEAVRVHEARAREQDAGLWPNPYVLLRKRRVEDFEFFSTGFLEVELGQKFELGGKRSARVDAARAEAEAVDEEVRALAASTLRDAELQYWRVLRLERDLARAREEAEAAGKLEGLARSRFASGKESRTAVLRFEATAEDARLSIADLERRHARACRELDDLLGQQAGTVLGVSGDFEGAILVGLNQEAARRLLLSHPRQQAAERSIEAARLAIDSAESAAWPDLTVALAYGHEESTGEDFTGLFLHLPIPLLNRNQGLRAERRAALLRARTSADAEALELAVELEAALIAYQQASANAAGYAEIILPKLEESFELTQSAFDSGRVSYFEVLDALLELIQARQTALEHLEQRARAATEIRYLTGLGG